jgi:hypothetical protein
MTYTGRFYPSGVAGRVPAMIEQLIRTRMGGVPGMARIELADLRLAWLISSLLRHVYGRRRLALTVVQREMVATVVNGLIGGAP